MTLNEYIEQKRGEFEERNRYFMEDHSCCFSYKDEEKFFIDSLRTLAAEFEKLVPEEVRKGVEVLGLDEWELGYDAARKETLSNIRAFIGETK